MKKNYFELFLKRHSVLTCIMLTALFIALFTVYCDQEPQRDRNSKTQLWAYKLSEDLHLALVPIEREQEPLDKAALRAQFPNPQLPPDGRIWGQRMQYYMPGATAPENPTLFYTSDLNATMGQQLDLNVVGIVSITPWTQEMYRTQPDAVRDARIGWKNITNANYLATHPLFEMHGMQCVVMRTVRHTDGKRHWQEGGCLAERANGEWAYFKYGNGLSGFVRAEYFTKAYGGLTVEWEASFRNLSRWREIDAKFWRLLDERNLAKKP
jgi:hypothetical protein